MILSSPEFLRGLGAALYDLQQRGQYCDLIVRCNENKEVSLHTVVAISASPFFASVLFSVGNSHPVESSLTVALPDIDSDVMQIIARFMYTAHVSVSPEQLESLQNVASYFEMKELAELCTTRLQKRDNQTGAVKKDSKRKHTDNSGAEEDSPRELVVKIERLEEEGEEVPSVDNSMRLLEVTLESMQEGEAAVYDEESFDTMSEGTERPKRARTATRKLKEFQADYEREEGNDSELNFEENSSGNLDWRKRVKGSEKSRILDLIRKKSISKKMARKHGIVLEMEEMAAHVGEHYHCPLCSRRFNVKFSWALHLYNTHNHNLQSILKCVSDDDIVSAGDPSTPSISSGFDDYEQGSGSRDGEEEFTPTEQQQLVRLAAASKKRERMNVPYTDDSRAVGAVDAFLCGHCTTDCSSLTGLKGHLEAKHAGSLNKCPNCNMGFSDRPALTVHLHNVHDRYPCPKCRPIALFESQDKVDDHVIEVHGENDLFTCPECGKVMSKSRQYTHMNLHYKDVTFECDLCGAKYLQKASLLYHRKHKHGLANERYACSHCDLTFNTSMSLKRHEVRHGDLKKYKCSKCPKRFYTHGELGQHEAYHVPIEQRPWICTVCNKRFIKEYTLKSHMVTHRTDFPFHCDHCGKRFRWKNKLKEHVRIHTGERPFQCRLCHERFTDCALRRHHEKKVHGDQLHEHPELAPRSGPRASLVSRKNTGRRKGTFEMLPAGSQQSQSTGQSAADELSQQTFIEEPDDSEEMHFTVDSDGIVSPVGAHYVFVQESSEVDTNKSASQDIVPSKSDRRHVYMTPSATESFVLVTENSDEMKDALLRGQSTCRFNNGKV